MSPEIIAALVASVLMAIGSLVTSSIAAIRTLQMLRPERTLSSADAISKFEEVANRAAERALKLDARIEKLEEERDALKVLIEKQRAIIDRQQREIELMTTWATRLVHQVRSLGAIPVSAPEDTSPINKTTEHPVDNIQD